MHRVRGQLRRRDSDHPALRSGLAANQITGIFGIVNGTCNYILSSMSTKDEAFAAALAKAQKRGYAEADPTLDISGGDSAHKLAILAAIAFGCEISLDDIFVQGLEGIARDDIRYGREMGYCLKLLTIAQRNAAGKISLRVHPSFIAADSWLARVDGSFNAISVFGSAVGETFYYGRGAGMMPTASAVVADLIDVALGNSRTIFESLRLKPRDQVKPLLEKIDDSVSRFYVRVMAKDKPGRGRPLRQGPRRPRDQYLGGPPARRGRRVEHRARGDHDPQDPGKEHERGPGGIDPHGRHQRQARVHPHRGHSAG